MCEFEFDERKSEANLHKHGIDFVAAQALWNDPYLIEIPARTEDEPRVIVIGRIVGRHWPHCWAALVGDCHAALGEGADNFSATRPSRGGENL